MKMQTPAARPQRQPGERIRNAMTCDVEDYFQVSAFAPYISRDSWPARECRVEANVERILALFERNDVKGTFFTLGWIAERYPQMVSRKPATNWPATATATCAPPTRAAPNSTTTSAARKPCWKISAASR